MENLFATGHFHYPSTICETSITLVVSLLIALMKNQVEALNKRGMNAVYVGEDCDMTKVEEGCYPILFMSPESLLYNSKWKGMLLSPIYQSHLIALVVDEAHCVKKWYVSLNSAQLTVACLFTYSYHSILIGGILS